MARHQRLRDDRGRVRHYIAQFIDISERKENESKLKYLAHYDALTGLPNRALFTDRLGQALGRQRREGGRLAVMFVDLDRFKNVNDSLGQRCAGTGPPNRPRQS